MPKLLKSGEVSEELIHKTVMDWVRVHPKLSKITLHYPNEGRRTFHYGRLLKSMGMRAGVSDLFIAKASHGYHGAWIELKTTKGKLSPSQRDFIEDMTEQNYYTAVCRSIDEAIATIKWYCISSE